MPKISNSTAIILKKRDFMENDMIVILLDEKGYRYEAIVKGARNGKSKRKNHLEVMNKISCTLYKSRAHLYLQSVECKSSFSTLKKQLDRIMQMNVILEIIEKTVLENDPHPEIYALLEETLKGLNQDEANAFLCEISLIKLAHFLGFLPNFKSCSACHKALLEDDALWNTKAGTLHCQSCGKTHFSHMPLKYRKAIDFFHKATHSECEKVVLKEEEHFQLKQFIPSLFLIHLDQPLKSLQISI